MKKWMGLEPRNVKLGIYGFLIMLLVSMFAIKPYLASAIYHNFARIDDYQFFANRIVEVAPQTQPWPESAQKVSGPKPETQSFLTSLKNTALLMIENGQIVYEKYDQPGGGPSGLDEISGSFSVAKSIIGILTGIAIETRAIGSIDDPIEQWITEWQDRPEGKITVKQLLQMTSGLNWTESYWNPFSITAEAYYGSDLRRTTLRQRLEVTPGTRFAYQSGSTQLLGLLISRATGKSLSSFLSEKLWKPLGAEHQALWSLDHEGGMEKAYCCLNATARDFARIGQLVLQKGQWNGKPLVSESFIQQMITPHLVSNLQGAPTDYYGFQWWVMKTAKGNVIPYARGILGQYVMVIPHQNRVVVRLGMKRGKTVNHHPEEVWALAEWAE